MQASHLAIATVCLGLACTSCTVNVGSEAKDSNERSAEAVTTAPAAPAAPAVPPAQSSTPAGTSSGYAENASVLSVANSEPAGLKIANASVLYKDGTTLKGDFRIYCPTQMIRPTNYILTAANGVIQDQGSWQENTFTPRGEGERILVRSVCG